jgi:protein SCO1/2
MTSARTGSHVGPHTPARRRILLAAGIHLVLGWPTPARPHDIGIVTPPRALPLHTPVLLDDGRRLPLRRLLLGRTSAVQLIFTGCSASCPLQGALFAGVQQQPVVADGRLQLLSLSIDPMDDAASLSAWLRRFGAQGSWRAAVPAAADIDVLRTALQARAPASSTHSSQVFFVDREGRLVWRSEDFPPAELVAGIATRLLNAG